MEMKILELQPSQLYLSAEKVGQVQGWMATLSKENIAPLPIKQLGQRIFLTDGHTRAFVALQRGWETLPVVWDEDDLKWEAYLTCVEAAEAQGIFTVADLSDRVLPPADYQEKWLDWCAPLFKEG